MILKLTQHIMTRYQAGLIVQAFPDATEIDFSDVTAYSISGLHELAIGLPDAKMVNMDSWTLHLYEQVIDAIENGVADTGEYDA